MNISRFLGFTPDGRRRYACDYGLPPIAGGADPDSDDQIDASADDAEETEDPGTVSINGNACWVNSDTNAQLRKWVGLRFLNGPFPAKGSTIDVAYISLNLLSTAADDPNLAIYAQDTAAPATFTTTPGNITGRTRTTASVPWVANGLGEGWKDSPSIVDVIQELATDYHSTAIVLILKPNSDATKYLDFSAWDEASHVLGAKLHLEWTEGGAGTSCDDQVDTSSDDGEEQEGTGGVDITQVVLCVLSHSSAAYRRWVACRFHNGPFPPQGSTVDVAYATIYTNASPDRDMNLDIHAEDGANPLTLTTDPYNITGRTRTAASVAWVQDGLPQDWVDSPLIVNVIQELVDSYSCTAMVIIFKPRTDEEKQGDIFSQEHADHTYGTKLHLEWTEGPQTLTPSPVTVPLVIPSPTVTLLFAKTLTPDPVTTSLAIPAPTLTLLLALTPDAVSTSLAVPAPTLLVEGSLQPAPVEIALSIPTPTLAHLLTLAPDPVSISLATPVPTVLVEGFLQPTPVAVALAIPSPTVVLVLIPDPVLVPLAIPPPALLVGGLILPAPVEVTLAVPSPTVALTKTLTPDPATVALAIPAPVVTSVLVLTPDPTTTSLAIPAPALALTLDLQPSPVAVLIAIPSPNITGVGVVLRPDSISVLLVIPTPTLWMVQKIISVTGSVDTLLEVKGRVDTLIEVTGSDDTTINVEGSL